MWKRLLTLLALLFSGLVVSNVATQGVAGANPTPQNFGVVIGDCLRRISRELHWERFPTSSFS